MSINGVRGMPHHEVKWKIETGLSSIEALEHVQDNFGHGSVQSPVGFSYDPKGGDLKLFYQISQRGTVHCGTHEHKLFQTRRAERHAKRAAKAQEDVTAQAALRSAVKANVEPAPAVSEPIAHLQTTGRVKSPEEIAEAAKEWTSADEEQANPIGGTP